MNGLLNKDYVLLSLHSKKHKGADAVIAKVRTKKGGGIPWFTILDGDGKERINSDAKGGNVGCPAQPHEIDWFQHMLTTTRSKLTDEEIGRVIAVNREFAARWLKR